MKLMSRDRDFTKQLAKYAEKIGIDMIGFADPRAFDRFSKRNRPQKFLKKTKTVIVLTMHLYDVILDAYSQVPNSGTPVQFMDSIMELKCYNLKEFLSNKGYESAIIPYNPGLYLKDSAALAGMGVIGKNNVLITKKFGSQVRLRAMVTTAPLITGEPLERNIYCKDCEKCIQACPADALDGGYSRQKCLSYNLAHMKEISKYSSIWCNICLEQCPHYKNKV
jgi:epoxyqueuosine reductase QueG